MTSFIRLDGVTPPTDRPRVDLVDDILPEAGALMLIDAAHPVAGWGAGVPASGSLLPNGAAQQCAAIVGSGASAATQPTLTYQALSGADGRIERTSRGGLHAIQSQQGAMAAGDGITITLPGAVLDYLATHPAHHVFASFWGQITRAGSASHAWSAVTFADSPSTSELLYSLANNGSTYPSARLGNARVPSGTWVAVTPQPVMANIGASGYTGTVGTARASKAWGMGSPGPFGNSTASAQPSAIFYRYYLEDLTLSGRTYSEVAALDAQMYAADVTTPGGRYYADTHTDPTTIP